MTNPNPKLIAAIQLILHDMNDPLNVNLQTLHWAARIEAALEAQSTPAQPVLSAGKLVHVTPDMICKALGIPSGSDAALIVAVEQAIHDGPPVHGRWLAHLGSAAEQLTAALRRTAHPVAQVVDGWISVDDRLPEPGTYWGVLSHGHVLQLHYSRGGYWTGGITRDCKSPTHWQPIEPPQPPMMEGDTNE